MESITARKTVQSFSPVQMANLPGDFVVASQQEVDAAVEKALASFQVYRSKSAEEKAVFLETIAEEITALGDELIHRAMLETGLPEARLIGERGRTTGQLKLFAELLREGSWVEAVIDTALPERKPLPRVDLRKMLVPIGPVAVFGASNFPFAFSTAGGDTASALAAGNPVIVKAHNSHLGTNALVASAIEKAIITCNMPEAVFSTIVGEGPLTGLQLVKNEGIKAVGFTGSRNAGMSIFRTAANERNSPIPVFAEMSSINPVLILPNKLKQDENLAAQVAASITMGVGQFCTNPGLLFMLKDETSDKFVNKLSGVLANSPAATMLNPNICQSYHSGRAAIASHKEVEVLFEGENGCDQHKASPFLTKVGAAAFISNPGLQEEVFGPASLIVVCKNKEEMFHALQSLEGQLTATILADVADIKEFSNCIDLLTDKVGRVVYNGVPTGVEVCYAMVHGGPFPATTNANSTSVGTDAIKRFVRPVCLQDCADEFLPDALKDSNPLNLMRRVNGTFTREAI